MFIDLLTSQKWPWTTCPKIETGQLDAEKYASNQPPLSLSISFFPLSISVSIKNVPARSMPSMPSSSPGDRERNCSTHPTSAPPERQGDQTCHGPNILLT